MAAVTTAQLARACRTFMARAYPGGAATIPAKKRIYFELPLDRPAADFLPPAPNAEGIVQVLSPEGGGNGWAFRLGSAHFPHLKLKLQLVDHEGRTQCVFMVDTHDAFSKNNPQPPADHPDAPAWLALQHQNRQLKEEIERDLEAEGLMTFNSLLRSALPKSAL